MIFRSSGPKVVQQGSEDGVGVDPDLARPRR